MSYAIVFSACPVGAEIVPVRIEVDVQPGLPTFTIIGLPDRRIEEAKERVRLAIKNSGLDFPLGRITVNLSPSDLPKQGTGFDLGIALGILQALGRIPPLSEQIWVVGELSLAGKLVALPRLMAILIAAWKKRLLGVVCPKANSAEIQAIYETPTLTDETLAGLVRQCQRTLTFSKSSAYSARLSLPKQYLIDQVEGQEEAKRALEIALSGGHHLFLTGPPGSGKTLLAQAAWQLLPALTRPEALEVAGLYDVAEKSYTLTSQRRPFQAPHYRLSASGLLGGGSTLYPGQLSLAHKGLLFLDEFAEMNREVRESLRQPLQEKQVQLVRKGKVYIYPADCLVIAAQNSCPCGLQGVEEESCRCKPSELARYASSLSQPLVDRFDLFVHLRKIKVNELGKSSQEGSSLRLRIDQCRKKQYRRLKDIRTNAGLTNPEIQQYCSLSSSGRKLLQQASQQFYLSARSSLKVLMMARTIADLAGDDRITVEHLQEALHYRYRPLVI